MSKSSLLRQISFYPNFLYFKMFIAHCHLKKMSQSRGAIQIIESFFDAKYSESQKEKLVKHYDNMEMDERRNTSKIKEE